MIQIDETYKRTNKNIIGRKQKIWFEHEGKQYLFKYGASNYEIYAELIAEQIGLQCGIDMAHYNVATYNGEIGVLTPSFLSDNELIISVDKLKKAVGYIFFENTIVEDLRKNTVENILKAVYTYFPDMSKDLFDELIKRWIFYGLIMESDKNETNIAFLRGLHNLRLAPDYDNSTMARLNENIDLFINNIKSENDIYNLTDNIKMSLKLKDSQTDNFIIEFDNFVSKNLDIAKKLMANFSNINIDEAIENCERENNIEIPWNVKYWVRKVITLRLRDMSAILKKYNIDEPEKSFTK